MSLLLWCLCWKCTHCIVINNAVFCLFISLSWQNLHSLQTSVIKSNFNTVRRMFSVHGRLRWPTLLRFLGHQEFLAVTNNPVQPEQYHRPTRQSQYICCCLGDVWFFEREFSGMLLDDFTARPVLRGNCHTVLTTHLQHRQSVFFKNARIWLLLLLLLLLQVFHSKLKTYLLGKSFPP